MVTLMTLLLVSCGGKDGSSSNKVKKKELNPICQGLSCLNSINWKIALQGKSFPDKTRVDINGITVLDECSPKQKYSIDRNVSPQLLFLDQYLIPKKGDLKIDIIDMGYYCNTESVFLSNDKIDFEITKNSDENEVLIFL